ncbi:SDR family NAD(P)-dependent oxidoreductase [Shewanella vesiculosa]|uniref:SDR family NAD(P)-dependent oxidoreductase n=1 Tax=Shewanella vesiculosa TaxID=518738 RepID=UPI00384B049F
MNLNLSGLNVVVTGGTAGIGAAIVECFAQEGANVAFCSRSQSNVENMLLKLQKYPVKATGAVLDVTNIEKFSDWVKSLENIDIFIPNVSALSGDWEASITSDIKATVLTTEAVIPLLKKSKNAAITYVGSKASSFATPGMESYGATKAAMTHYMKSLSRGLVSDGIRVNTLSPGDTFFEGGFWEQIKNNAPDIYQSTLEGNPMNRFCTPEEVAKAVIFLSSPAASFVTGSNLLIDGGATVHVHG